MANDGKDAERMALLGAKFIQIQLMPAEVGTHSMALMALDAIGHIWEYRFDRQAWVMIGTNRELPQEY